MAMRNQPKKMLKLAVILGIFCAVFIWPKSPVNVSAVEADGEYDVLNGLYITVDDETADALRNNYFEGYITFEYLDEGTGKFMVLTDTSRPSNDGSDYSVVAGINKGNTGRWIKAKVRVYAENAAFTHRAENSSDFIFKGDAKVRNISFDFDIFSMNP